MNLNYRLYYNYLLLRLNIICMYSDFNVFPILNSCTDRNKCFSLVFRDNLTINRVGVMINNYYTTLNDKS